MLHAQRHIILCTPLHSIATNVADPHNFHVVQVPQLWWLNSKPMFNETFANTCVVWIGMWRHSQSNKEESCVVRLLRFVDLVVLHFLRSGEQVWKPHIQGRETLPVRPSIYLSVYLPIIQNTRPPTTNPQQLTKANDDDGVGLCLRPRVTSDE